MKTTIAVTAVFLTAATGAVLAGPKHHHGDVIVTVEAGRLITATEHDDTLEHERVFGGELGELIPGFGDEPGFEGHGLPALTQVGFDILDALRIWNGSDFGAISPSTLTLELAPGVPGSPSATTPALPGFVPGFIFGTADEEGEFHQHIGMTLNAPGDEGVYLVQLRAFSPTDTSGGLVPSESFWLVLNNGMDENTHDAAIDYVRSVIVPAPGALLVSAGMVLAGIRRRR